MLAETFVVTATTTAMIMFILFGAFVLQFVLGFLGIPTAVSNWIAGLGAVEGAGRDADLPWSISSSAPSWKSCR